LRLSNIVAGYAKDIQNAGFQLGGPMGRGVGCQDAPTCASPHLPARGLVDCSKKIQNLFCGTGDENLITDRKD
jgi:hypothetical protein